MAGTVNLSREFWDDEAFRDEPFTQREAFLWFVTEASWKDRTRRVGTVVVELKRGQLSASTRFMAKRWKWTEPRVRRYLDMLVNRRMVQTQSDAGVTVITVCKYNEYQNKPKSTDAPMNVEATQERRTSDANENKGVIQGKEGSKKVSLREPDGFEEFWSVVPRKQGKDAARKKFVLALKKAPLEVLVSKMATYAESREGEDPKYTVQPARWLNEGRWKDELASTPTNGASHERPRTAQERAAANHSDVASAWIAEGRRRDQERGIVGGEADSGDPGDLGMDSGQASDAVVSLFPAGSGHDGFGRSGFGLDEHPRQISAGGYRDGM